MRAQSGSGGRKSKYKYARALSFLRSTMVSRSPVGSTREPAVLNPSGAIPQESATEGHIDSPGPSAPYQPSLTSDPLVPSTSAGASWPPALHESTGEDIAFLLPHPSNAATSSTPVGSGQQRQRGQEKSYAPEFLHLNAAFQNCLKLLSEQMTAGFNLLSNSILELHTRLDRMYSDASKSPNHTFFQSVLERMDKLSTDQQMQVMQLCQSALALITSQATPPAPPSSHCPSLQPLPTSCPVPTSCPIPTSRPVSVPTNIVRASTPCPLPPVSFTHYAPSSSSSPATTSSASQSIHSTPPNSQYYSRFHVHLFSFFLHPFTCFTY
ncbi:uncharacterized protein [Ranitomeya imitator]|uniref:uncharacterized protein isoform X1 n=1 Tax=Ranitomeya imitator TaxID=111125 RepID=UPI0037E78ACA